MDTNHRGGPEGFVRLLSNTKEDCTLVYPEYSGNRLYQTLGNLRTTPKAGLVFVDFDTGDVLYVTGTAEILAGEGATNLLPRTNLAVKVQLSAAKFVSQGLSFRGVKGEPSPYNPPVRFLTTEQRHDLSQSTNQRSATLISKQFLTPTISRFRFKLSSAPTKLPAWEPGQYVALSFADELDIGYSHMRDDDPKSLNDDFLRTFTVSSPPPSPERSDAVDEFEITIRKVGAVTTHLFRTNPRAGFLVHLLGFGGDFSIHQDRAAQEQIAFVAGGIGITPLLAQAEAHELDLENVSLFWTVRAQDLGLVADAFERVPGLGRACRVFVTRFPEGNGKTEEILRTLEGFGGMVWKRRIEEEDLKGVKGVARWFVCAGTELRGTVLEWLKGETVLYEDFNY
jgi:NAD(P)H-flavin reductase